MQQRKPKGKTKKESSVSDSLNKMAETVEKAILIDQKAKQRGVETLRRFENAAFMIRIASAYIFRLDRLFRHIETETQFQQNISYDMEQIAKHQYEKLHGKN